MTTPINTFEDILDAMERDPALRDALRRHILTDELLQMPLRLEQFITEQKDFNEDMRERTSNTLTRLDRMEGDSGTLKGYWARNTAVSDAPGIAHDMGLEFVRTLTASDLMELAGDQLGLDTGRSFRRADLVIEATRDGATEYARPGGFVHRRPEGLREGAQERRAPDTVHRQAGHSRRCQRPKHPRSRTTGGIRRTVLAPAGGPDPGPRVNKHGTRRRPVYLHPCQRARRPI